MSSSADLLEVVSSIRAPMVATMKERIGALAAARPDEIEKYASICRAYTLGTGLDALVGNFTGHLALHDRVVRPALARALAPGDRVLDFACGTGRVTQLAVDASSPGGIIVGADVSWPAVSRATLIVPRAVFLLLPGTGDIPMPPWGFDAIISLVALQHIQFFPVRHRYFQTFQRLLRVGGRLLMQLNADRSGLHVDWLERGTPDCYEAPDVVCDESTISAYLQTLGFGVEAMWRTEMDTNGVAWHKRPTGIEDGWLWVLAKKLRDP